MIHKNYRRATSCLPQVHSFGLTYYVRLQEKAHPTKLAQTQFHQKKSQSKIISRRRNQLHSFITKCNYFNNTVTNMSHYLVADQCRDTTQVYPFNQPPNALYSDKSLTDLVNKNTLRYIDTKNYKREYINLSLEAAKVCCQRSLLKKRRLQS
jgi:hypothetical protein